MSNILRILWAITLLVTGVYYSFTNDFGTTDFALGWIMIACAGLVADNE